VIVNQVTVIGRRPAYMIPDVAVVSPSSTKRPKVSTVKPCASMIASVRRAVIAGILNRQQRTTAYGHRFTANHVGASQPDSVSGRSTRTAVTEGQL
jgi:hypothetical protein